MIQLYFSDLTSTHSAIFNFVINVNQHPYFYHVNIFSNVCKFEEFRRIMKEFYDIFQDFEILDLRTTEPFRSDSRTFFLTLKLRTFGLKNLRTHEPSNLRTFGLMRCNRFTYISPEPEL